MNADLIVGRCGVCCNHCGMSMRIPRMAEELKRLIVAYRYGDWIGNVAGGFDFDEMMKGLEWFTGSGCGGCLEGGGMPRCDVRECCAEKGLENCYFCEDFRGCEKLNHQKETYEVGEHFEKIRRLGYENWVREQEKKIADGFDNIEHLERREVK